MQCTLRSGSQNAAHWKKCTAGRRAASLAQVAGWLSAQAVLSPSCPFRPPMVPRDKTLLHSLKAAPARSVYFGQPFLHDGQAVGLHVVRQRDLWSKKQFCIALFGQTMRHVQHRPPLQRTGAQGIARLESIHFEVLRGCLHQAASQLAARQPYLGQHSLRKGGGGDGTFLRQLRASKGRNYVIVGGTWHTRQTARPANRQGKRRLR